MPPHRGHAGRGSSRGRGGSEPGAPQVVHAPRHAKSGGGGSRGGGADGGGHADDGAPSMARGFSRLDPATAAYYAEARETLTGLETAPPPFDADQAALLASAALREAGGREAAVAADAAGSRALEALLPYAPPEDVLDFAGVVLDGDALADVATSPFGSHTAEVLLATVARLADGSAPVLRSADEEAVATATTAATAALEGVTAAFGRRFYDLATHRSGSHVLRALLTCLAGRDVAPTGGGGGGGGGGASVDGASALRAARRKVAPGGGGGGAAAAAVGLPSKVAAPGGHPVAATHPHLIRQLADVLLSPEYAPWLEELAYGFYAGPAVQALLRAGVGDDDLLSTLIPRLLGAPPPKDGDPPPKDGARLASIPKDTILAAARDRAGSHLLEAVLATAPRPLRVELDARALRGRLADLASHPTANFVVQAALAAADSLPAVKGALKELGPAVGQLLEGRRGGVVAALVAAAGRVPALPAEVAAAVATGVAATRPHPAGLAAALLTLDTPDPGTPVEEVGRLSPVGCALLAALLRLPPAAAAGGGAASSPPSDTPSPRGAGAAFGDALAALPPPTLALVAADSAGSRAVEALFTGGALGQKASRSAAAKLLGRLGTIAATPGGVHAVEAAWTAAKPADKEAMTAELAAAAGGLGNAFRTVALLRKCGVTGRGASAWKSQQQQQWRGGGGVAAAVPSPPTPVPAEVEAVAEEEEAEAEEEAVEDAAAAAPKERKEEEERKKKKRSKEERAARKKWRRGGSG